MTAQELFDAIAVADAAEMLMWDEMERIFGEEGTPFDDIYVDHYDTSIELLQARPGWELPADKAVELRALGFARCWVVYPPGTPTPERYYDFGAAEEGRAEP